MAPTASLPKVPPYFNFATSVVDSWATDPSRRALLWTDGHGSTPRDLTFAHFSARSKRAAALLASLGAVPGDRMLLLMARRPEWWEVATAAIRAGVVLCPCTTLAVPKDIEFRAQTSGAKIFVGDAACVKKFLEVRQRCQAIKIVVQVGDLDDDRRRAGVVGFEEGMEQIGEAGERSYKGPMTKSSDPCIIYFTSGTTGMPKMVLHNQVSYPLGHTITGTHWLQLAPGKLFWNMSEQGWAKAAWSWFGSWNMGAALFVEDTQGAFNAPSVLDNLHKYPITTFCAPPTVYRQLVTSSIRQYMKKKPPKALEHCVGAGEPLGGQTIKVWQEMTGLTIKDGYGQTETIILCGNFGDDPVRPGSMGKPSPGVPVAIINEAGNISKTGDAGDIAVSTVTENGEKVMCIYDGYLSTSGELTRKLRKKPGSEGASRGSWYLTGDRGYMDEGGYIWFIGRDDDVISSAGYRIGPFEVESTLQRHPSVLENAVVASPDPDRGEIVKAFIVLSDEYKSHDKDKLTAELQEFCKREAAPYKYPRKIQFVDPSFLPKTISGKIRRVELRQLEYGQKASKL